MKRKILFVIPSMTGGGAQKVFTVLLRHLDPARFDLFLVLLDTEGHAGIFLKDIPGHVAVKNLSCKRVRYSLLPLLRHIRELRPDAVLSTLGHLNIFLAMLKIFFPRNTRLWIREANTPSRVIEHSPHPRLFRFLYRHCYVKADGVICQSKIIEEDLLKTTGAGAKNKITVIPNPIDFTELKKAYESGLPPFSRHPHIVASGRLTHQKGFDLLIRAFALLLKNQKAYLTVLGAGPQEPVLRQLIKEGNMGDFVTLAGFHANPYGYYRHADLFALPSRWEGLPNAAMEALACGTPVVAFDQAGAIGDLVRHGENGILATANSAEAFAQGLSDGLKLSAGLTKAALLDDRFGVKNVIQQYEKILLH